MEERGGPEECIAMSGGSGGGSVRAFCGREGAARRGLECHAIKGDGW